MCKVDRCRAALVAVLFVLIPSLLLLFGVASTSAVAASIDSRFFGLHIRFIDQPPPRSKTLTQWPQIRFGSWRVWNSYVDWLDLEPERGHWVFRRLDRYMALAEAADVDLYLTLGRTPRWASARPDELCGNHRGCAAEPQKIEDWEAYVRAVVTRYRGRIKGYEIWNEPAFSEVDRTHRPDGRAAQFYSGSAARMVELAASAYRIIKEIDPAALVVSPSVTIEGNGFRRLEAYLRAGGGRYMDVLGFHFYVTPPELLPAEIGKLRKLMAKYGLAQTPIWNTEMGYVFASPEIGVLPTEASGRWQDVLTDQVGAAYVARALILNAAGGIGRVFWFNWDHNLQEGPMGLSKDGGRYLRPAANAYAAVYEWLVGMSPPQCERSSSGLWRCLLSSRGESQGEIYWAESAAREQVQIPSGFRCVRRINGAKLQVASNEVQVTNEPQLLVRDC